MNRNYCTEDLKPDMSGYPWKSHEDKLDYARFYEPGDIVWSIIRKEYFTVDHYCRPNVLGLTSDGGLTIYHCHSDYFQPETERCTHRDRWEDESPECGKVSVGTCNLTGEAVCQCHTQDCIDADHGWTPREDN